MKTKIRDSVFMGHNATGRDRQLMFNYKQRRIYVKSRERREERNTRKLKKKHTCDGNVLYKNVNVCSDKCVIVQNIMVLLCIALVSADH